ncbi:ORF6N domain-containing protein [Candidatus Acidulodesulfobacterium sp. H_13]|uniref:ORF6N domain-containing protein n=1 Tax=Candidatus Acidulodesulfobacterium sp. H_13 TaxID=3395470 RepID=UPI003AF79C47
MINKTIAIDDQVVQNKIYTIRNMQVMLDRDLAELYGVETKRINEQVKRNIERFDSDFMFQLTEVEFEILKSQNVISSSNWGGVRSYLMFLQSKVCICLQQS